MIGLKRSPAQEHVRVQLPISKSVLNRELILAAIAKGPLPRPQSDWPEDCRIMVEALESKADIINIGHAGTAMRFLTSYLSLQGESRSITGSGRMLNRPIGPLVDALRELGTAIDYSDKEGYPPLLIKAPGQGGSTHIDAGMSSQYVSALLLSGAAFPKGLTLEIEGDISSQPYIDLSLDVMSKWGLDYERTSERHLHIPHQAIQPRAISLEADWSAAAFMYGYMALGCAEKMHLPGLSYQSAQGDKACASLFAPLGVKTSSNQDGILLERSGSSLAHYEADLSDHPDLAQALVFTCAAMGIGCTLTGLHTLPIKETDRLLAMQETLALVGITAHIDGQSISFEASNPQASQVPFETYEDHRMAMSIAIMTPALDYLEIKDEAVVGKSFPRYWDELDRAGILSLIRNEV